jgi:DNA modification methylase
MRLGLITCLFLSGFGTSGLASDRPTVILYTTAGCRPCQLALRSLRDLGIEPTVSRDCPEWVRQVPTVHWQDTSGRWFQHAPRHWSGPTWTDAETAKLRRWLLMPSAAKSTARDPYLMVTALDSLPAPYYQRGPVTLYHGDCLELLPHLPRVDAVVTDPPYGIDYGRSGGFNASHGWGPWRENVAWDQDRPSRELFDQIRHVSEEQIIWGGNYFTDYLPPTMRWLVWDKGQRDFSLADCEFAWTNQNKASRIFNYARAKAMQDGKVHPTQKPIALMEWCLSFVSDAQSVCDPFCGSGTTLVACIRSGVVGIGIERDESYCEAAAKRCDRELDQKRIEFEPAKRVETQRELFAEVSRG